MRELDEDPHPLLARLRAREPVTWLAALNGWLITRYDLTVRVLCDPATFTVDDPRFSTSRVVGRACSRWTARPTPAPWSFRVRVLPGARPRAVQPAYRDRSRPVDLGDPAGRWCGAAPTVRRSARGRGRHRSARPARCRG
ncbi:hypothetical protein I552_6520 [Mycobacterium xenopi 3993]|nr:hypothetical protein I552_6520 [Mycobacterium xenopi 3993]